MPGSFSADTIIRGGLRTWQDVWADFDTDANHHIYPNEHAIADRYASTPSNAHSGPNDPCPTDPGGACHVPHAHPTHAYAHRGNRYGDQALRERLAARFVYLAGSQQSTTTGDDLYRWARIHGGGGRQSKNLFEG